MNANTRVARSPMASPAADPIARNLKGRVCENCSCEILHNSQLFSVELKHPGPRFTPRD
jgi:hypothetical protein